MSNTPSLGTTITTGGGTSTNDPINNAQAYDTVVINGVRSPGLVHLRGFERKSGWQRKHGKGAVGETINYSGKLAAEGELVFTLWRTSQFVAWGNYLPLFLANPVTDPASLKSAISIYHPTLVDLNMSAFVVESVSPLVNRGKGRWEASVKLLEFIPVPQVNVGSQNITFANTTPPPNMPAVGYTPPTVLQSLKHVNAQLMQALQNQT
jgi:hypothetical protein